MRYFLFLILLLSSGLFTFVFGENEYIIHRNYYPPRGKIVYATLSNDGRYVLAIDKQHSIRVWTYHTGRALRTLRSGEHKATIAVMHPAKSFLFTGGKDGNINVWDLKKGSLLKTLSQHSTPITALSISGNGEFLVSGAQDKKVLLWKLDRYKVIEKISDPSRKITDISFHPSSGTFAWSNTEQEVKVWDIRRRKVVASHKKHLGAVTGLQFNPKTEIIASASADKTIIFWDWKQKKILKTVSGHSQRVSAISFHPSGKQLLSCSTDSRIYLWNTSTYKIASELAPSDKALIGCTFSQSGKEILGVFKKNNLRTWSLGNKGKWGNLSGHKRSIQSLDISPNGSRLISASTDMTIKLWNILPDGKKLIRSYPFKDYKVEQIRFSPDNRYFATATTNSQIIIWDSKKSSSGSDINYALKSHTGKVNTIDFHPNRNFLISGGADKRVILWDLDQKKSIYQSEVHSGQIESIRYSNTGHQYATASKDKTVKVWDAKNHRLQFVLKGHKKGVRKIAFSPTSRILASASDDRTISIWDLSNGKLIKNFLAHDFVISALQFSPDGNTLISASRDKTIRLWNIRDGSFIKTLSGEKEQITSIATHPKRRLLAVGTLGTPINMLVLPRKYFRPSPKSRSKTTGTTSAPQTKLQELRESSIPLEDGGAFARELSDSGINAQDTKVEKVVEVKDKIFDPVIEAVDRELLANQSRLNTLMGENKICENASEVELISYNILKKVPSDQMAYYALMKSFIVNKDLQMIYLMAKIGQHATFYKDKYNFISKSEANEFFYSWMATVFSQSVMGAGSDINLEFTDCHGEISTLYMPNYLLFIDLPQETIENITKDKVSVDFRILAGSKGTPEAFRNRVFALIEAVEKKRKVISEPILKEYMPGIEGWYYGYVSVNLSNIQQWGVSSERLKFQIKRERNEWMTFFTSNNKQKTVLLKQGNYYVKVNNKVRKAFILDRKDQRIEVKPE